MSKPDDIIIGPEGSKTTNFYDAQGLHERTLPRSILLLRGHDPHFTPFKCLWDSGATNCILSAPTARRLGYNVPEHPTGHGSMKVANGASANIYGWTKGIRIRPSEHLDPGDGSGRLVTSLASMRCLVADICEDVIIGFDYIDPMRGGFERENGKGCFRLACDAADDAPKVNIPLLGFLPTGPIRHYELDNGFGGPSVRSDRCSANHIMAPAGPRAASPGRRSNTKKDRAEAMELMQYIQDNPHMVTSVEWRPKMSPDATLFPDWTTL